MSGTIVKMRDPPQESTTHEIALTKYASLDRKMVDLKQMVR
jgi:hypothetical protein